MKEAIKTIVIVLLVFAAVYFALVVDKVNNRMDEINVQDSLNVVANEDFDHQLHDLRLQFIGRGKHIQEFQKSVADLNQKLDLTKAIFSAKVDSVGLIIGELRMNTEAELSSINNNIEQLNGQLASFKRQTQRTLTDLQTNISRMNREMSDLEKRIKAVEPTEEEEEDKRRR